MKTFKLITILSCAMLLGLVSACKPEPVAPPVVTDLVAYPGNGRALVEFTAPAEAVSGKLFYNNGDVIDFEIQQAKQSVMVEDLAEGEQTIRVVTISAEGLTSDPLAVTVQVYGPKYAATLTPRGMNAQTFTSATSARFEFGDSKEGETELHFFYTGTDGQDKMVVLGAGDNVLDINGIDFSKPYAYSSVFKPEPGCLDEFETARIDAQKASMKNFNKVIWGAEASSAAGYGVEKLIDNDVNSCWRASGAGAPASVIIDFKQAKLFDAINLSQAQGTDGGCFVKLLSIEISQDGSAWTSLFDDGVQVCPNAYRQTIALGREQEARFVKLTALETTNAALPVQLAEIDFVNDLGASGESGTDISQMPVLVNNRYPFQGDGSDRFNAVGAGRFQQVTGWTHNEAADISFDSTAGNYMCIWSANDWGCPSVTNGKVYQSIDLLAGEYILAVTIYYMSTPGGSEAYATVSAAASLPDISDIQAGTAATLALQRVDMTADTAYRVPFTLDAPSTITVGYVYNTYNYNAISGGTVPWSEVYFTLIDVQAN